jgi:hypothetical protein
MLSLNSQIAPKLPSYYNFFGDYNLEASPLKVLGKWRSRVICSWMWWWWRRRRRVANIVTEAAMVVVVVGCQNLAP